MLFYLQPCLGSLLMFGIAGNNCWEPRTLLPHRVEAKWLLLEIPTSSNSWGQIQATRPHPQKEHTWDEKGHLWQASELGGGSTQVVCGGTWKGHCCCSVTCSQPLAPEHTLPLRNRASAKHHPGNSICSYQGLRARSGDQSLIEGQPLFQGTAAWVTPAILPWEGAPCSLGMPRTPKGAITNFPLSKCRGL